MLFFMQNYSNMGIQYVHCNMLQCKTWTVSLLSRSQHMADSRESDTRHVQLDNLTCIAIKHII